MEMVLARRMSKEVYGDREKDKINEVKLVQEKRIRI